MKSSSPDIVLKMHPFPVGGGAAVIGDIPK